MIFTRYGVLIISLGPRLQEIIHNNTFIVPLRVHWPVQEVKIVVYLYEEELTQWIILLIIL